MRMIGSLESASAAQSFGDFLFAKGIDTNIEQGQNGNWQVWIVSESDVEQAQRMLDEFLRDPGNPKYRDLSNAAQERRQEQEAERRRRQANYVDVRRRWAALGSDKLGPVTGLMIAVSIVVAIASNLGGNQARLMPLLIRGYESYEVEGVRYIRWNRDLPEITEKGQVWRLITPIFIHYGFMHILFNMWWLKDLGSMIERRENTLKFLMVVVLSGVASNLAQFWVSGPTFGGMSGVVYALLGYAWMRSKFDPKSGLYVSPSIMQFMVMWFFLCILLTRTHFMPVANTAHGVGLGMGVLLAAVTSRGLWRRVFGS